MEARKSSIIPSLVVVLFLFGCQTISQRPDATTNTPERKEITPMPVGNDATSEYPPAPRPPLSFRGLNQNRPFVELTHNEIYDAFRDTPFTPSSHAGRRTGNRRGLSRLLPSFRLFPRPEA